MIFDSAAAFRERAPHDGLACLVLDVRMLGLGRPRFAARDRTSLERRTNRPNHGSRGCADVSPGNQIRRHRLSVKAGGGRCALESNRKCARPLSRARKGKPQLPVHSGLRRGWLFGSQADLLRMAAVALSKSKTALGAEFRRTVRRKNGKIAVFSTARRLAILIYRLLRYKSPLP